MKKQINLFGAVVLTIFFLVGCAGVPAAKRGLLEENQNVYFSTHSPNIMITLNDKFNYREKHQSFYFFTGDGRYFARLGYRSNPHKTNRNVDYYYPIDKVLYDSCINRGCLAYKHGEEKIDDQTVYYCYHIFTQPSSIVILKEMVIKSLEQDWVIIQYGQMIPYSKFKDDYSSARQYFETYPQKLQEFDAYFQDSIVSIGKYPQQAE